METQFRKARVARLKARVEQGSYRVDPDAVASSLLRRPSAALILAPAPPRRAARSHVA